MSNRRPNSAAADIRQFMKMEQSEGRQNANNPKSDVIRCMGFDPVPICSAERPAYNAEDDASPDEAELGVSCQRRRSSSVYISEGSCPSRQRPKANVRRRDPIGEDGNSPRNRGPRALKENELQALKDGLRFHAGKDQPNANCLQSASSSCSETTSDEEPHVDTPRPSFRRHRKIKILILVRL